MLYKIGDFTFNLADVVSARQVNADHVIDELLTKHVFFIVKLNNGDELFCCKDSPTYEEFVEAWEEVVPKFKPKHNVSHYFPNPQHETWNCREIPQIPQEEIERYLKDKPTYQRPNGLDELPPKDNWK